MPERYYFGQHAANELRELQTKVRKLEQFLLPSQNGRQQPTAYVVKVGESGITARSGTTAGSGLASLVLRAGESKELSDRTPKILIQNLAVTTYSEGDYLLVHRDAYGDYWTSSSFSDQTQIYQATVADTINPGESGAVTYDGFKKRIIATNWSDCQVTHGDRVFLYAGTTDTFFTPCKCCTGSDYDCCDTAIWVCVCGEQLLRIPTDGSEIEIDTSDCCSGDCSVSAAIKISLSCTSGTITGTVTQYCDDGAGSPGTGSPQSLNSTSLSALCDTDTQSEYLTALAFPIGYCNPSIKFYNYEPTDCKATSSCDFDAISTSTVTIAGVSPRTAFLGTCSPDLFNGTHSLAETAVGKWNKTLTPAQTCCQMDGARVSLEFLCDTNNNIFTNADNRYFYDGSSWVSIAPGVPLGSSFDYAFRVVASAGVKNSCCFAYVSIAFYANEADIPITSIDTGVIQFDGTANSVLTCNGMFWESAFWSSVTVRVQTS